MGKKSAPAPYIPPPPVDYAQESVQRQKEEAEMDAEIVLERTKALNKKKSGRYATLLTGGEGLQDEADVKTRSLLGSGKK
jgi:hypothetical protein